MIYFDFVLSGGTPRTGLLLAGLIGGGGGLAFALIIIIEDAGAAAEISFGAAEILWRTRFSRVHRTEYGKVVSVTTMKWRGDWSGNAVGAGMPLRYVVYLAGPFGLRTGGFWLTPDNKRRLDDALRKWRTH